MAGRGRGTHPDLAQPARLPRHRGADGLGVIALQNATNKTVAGELLFFNAQTHATLGTVTVGAHPDMVGFSPHGKYAVVANEGEPADDFSSDPEGSVGVVSLPAGVAAPSQDDVVLATFHAFETGGTKTLPADVRVFGSQPHGADLPVSRNLEPEYVAFADDKAYVTLQENDGVAVVDLQKGEVESIWALGFQDHAAAGKGFDGFDGSDRSTTAEIKPWERLKGIYQPDGIKAYTANGQTYLVTANEGDAREWGDYVEGSRLRALDKQLAQNLQPYRDNNVLGRLNVTTELGKDDSGKFQELYSFGSRSFSIWTTDGTQVFDSGDDFEQITLEVAPEFFNSNHSESSFKTRSDDKGPEPEGITLGEIGGRTYAFIGFKRVGGTAVYDITEPTDAKYVSYVNRRDFSVNMEGVIEAAESASEDVNAAIAQTLPKAGDLGPEGLEFIPAEVSPPGSHCLLLAPKCPAPPPCTQSRSQPARFRCLQSTISTAG